MLPQMRAIWLILQKDQGGELILREMFVTHVSKWLRKTDVVTKAYHALMRTLYNNKFDFLEDEDMDMLDIDLDRRDVLENIVSKYIGKH